MLPLRRPFHAASPWLVVSMLTPGVTTADDLHRQYLSLDGAASFRQITSDPEVVLVSPRITPSIAWDQLVVSWNFEAGPGGHALIGARLAFPDRVSTVYQLGSWSTDPSDAIQTSVAGQEDADASVRTDTLIAHHPDASVEIYITLIAQTGGVLPRLKRLGLAFADSSTVATEAPATNVAWGLSLPVPERSQLAYEGGRSWCSPTCVAMVLGFWSACLNRPELDLPVPHVADCVFDPAWPGTGNWAFNAAFAGSFPGLDASVRRLATVSDIEVWIRRGVPVVTSVSYGLLKGTNARPDDGHLVVCIGFTSTGDPVIHDPGTRHDIRKIIPRDQFARAWNFSRNTVYLIHPTQAAAQTNGLGRPAPD